MHSSERGASLVVAMIMLVIITLLVVYAIRASNVNQRIAGNMQFQAEAASAAAMGIEDVLSQARNTADITKLPAFLATAPVVTTEVVNGVSYNVSIQPMGNSCLSEAVILSSQLNLSTSDVNCLSQADQGDSVITSGGGLSTTRSGCVDQLWEVQVTATDATTGASVTQVQGFSKRVFASKSSTACR